MNDFKFRFKSKYPTLWDFMETSLWPDVDGNNQILLLHQIAFFDDPSPAQKLAEELEALSTDDEIQGHEIASLINQAGIDPPYQVVNPENARHFAITFRSPWLLSSHSRNDTAFYDPQAFAKKRLN